MLDFGFNFMNTKIYIDNESTICIVKNPVFYSKTKYIEIRHHFIRDSYEKRLIQVIKIHIDYNVADLLTKAFDVSRFNFLIASIGLLIPEAKHIEYLVGDEAVHKELGDRMERAATTASSLEAEHDSENEEMEMTTAIDGRVKTITQASIRRHLKLEDADGISSLPNTEIFEQLALMGPKKTAWEQFNSNIATAIICLATNRTFNFSKMIFEDKDRYNADIRATNILLQGLPKDIYSLINHYTDAKDIWDNVKMLLEGLELTKEDRESQLYDDFKHFCQNKGETIHDYYVRFAKLINDMRNLKMTMSRMQLNSKFISNMLPKWGRFVTVVKLNRGLRDSNYDQLYAYLKQHEAQANENKTMLDRFTQHNVDPLALMSNVSHQHHYLQSSTTQPSTYVPPHFADNTQLDLGLSPIDNLIDNLTNTLALLTQSYKTYLPQTNNQLRTSSNTRNQATVHDGRVVVQNVQGRQNRGQGNNARGRGAAGNGGAQNRVGNANPDGDDGIPRHRHVMANLSIRISFYDEAEHEMHDEYVKDNAVPVVQSNVSSIPNDAYMMIFNDMHAPHAQPVPVTTRNTIVNNSLTAELATYKEQVKLYERRVRFKLTEREQKIDEQLRIVITDRNIKEETLKKELHFVKMQLASTINHNKSMVEEVTSLKKDFKQKENKYLEEFLDMKALKEKVEDKLYKQDQSLQTVHMLCKPKPYYNEQNKVAIGYKNPLCLTRVKQLQPALYNGYEIIKNNHVSAIVHNT
ncbi:hypothetical protein Tco_1377546 [Tanacetum coccineum]